VSRVALESIRFETPIDVINALVGMPPRADGTCWVRSKPTSNCLREITVEGQVPTGRIANVVRLQSKRLSEVYDKGYTYRISVPEKKLAPSKGDLRRQRQRQRQRQQQES